MVDVWQTALRGSLDVFDLAQPTEQWVPTGAVLVHQPPLAWHAFVQFADDRRVIRFAEK